jgi:preprotein translocase subunit SecY
MVEIITGQTVANTFAGTSTLIMVGVATDIVRKLQAEQIVERFIDKNENY